MFVVKTAWHSPIDSCEAVLSFTSTFKSSPSSSTVFVFGKAVQFINFFI
jgi:hypothetical protein